MNKIEMSGISKSFYGVKVLQDVDLKVTQGSIHALIGENGAGKSTLMNILGGVLSADQGSIKINGIEVKDMTIKKAESKGIAFVHQEINLFNTLQAYENIFMGKEITHGKVFLNKKEMITRSNELFSDLGVQLKATDLVGNLSTAQKQLLEICKALFSNADCLILDEPTTSLNNEEIDNFFRIIKKLQKEGKTFIFISHKMPEIFRICDEYTVLRNGKLISFGKIEDTTPEKVTSDIVGPGNSSQVTFIDRPIGNTILELHNLSGNGFHDVNLSIKKGQIIGFTGLEGAGSSELMQAIFGLKEISSGKILFRGENITGLNTGKIMKHGIGMIPANRKENSVFGVLDILNNFSLASYTTSKSHFSKKKDLDSFNNYKKEMSIKADKIANSIVSLSGGNQQKIIIARWLYTNADLLLLDNPTQGIDVGAKAEVYRLLLKIAQTGKTIIFNTLELSEIRKCADDCYVFYHGSIAASLNREQMDDKTVMMFATGANKTKKEAK